MCKLEESFGGEVRSITATSACTDRITCCGVSRSSELGSLLPAGNNCALSADNEALKSVGACDDPPP
eukprot:929248-Rhodomonas_salina.1